MKRVLKWFVLPMLLVVGALVTLANLLAEPGSSLPPPDPARLITLPDGRKESLGELLARAPVRDLETVPREASEPASEPAAGVAAAEPAAPPTGVPIEEIFMFQWPPVLASDETDVFLLGRHAMQVGRPEEALALLQSVPEDHEEYDTAQRFIGWELLTKRMDKPALGLAYMNRALNDAPLEGENWQDASRVYLRTLGIRWDPVNNRMR